MEYTVHFRNGDVVREICTLPKEINETELLSQRNPSVVGTISHLKTNYLSCTKKRQAGMGSGKSRGKVVPAHDCSRC